MTKDNTPGHAMSAPVCIGEVRLVDSSELAALGIVQPRILHIHARRMPYSSGKYPDAWCACYEIIETLQTTGTQTAPLTHRLQQHNSVMYHDGSGADTRQSADMLKPAQMPCLRHRPRWKRTGATWPFTPGNKPFVFAAHFYVSQTATTSRRAAPRIPATDLLCLFLLAGENDRLQFRIFSQNINRQTAGEHYALEASIADYEAARRFPARNK